MKKQLQRILTALSPALNWGQRYYRLIFFSFLILACSFLVYQISSYANIEPTDNEVNDQLKTITRPHIDANAVSKIQQLRGQNIKVETLFTQTRSNPFSE